MPGKMKATLVFLVVALVSPAFSLDLLKGVIATGENTVSAVATPTGKAVVGATLKKCDIFKQIFGVTYDRLSETMDPDVSQLTLDLWITSDNKKRFNIMDAAEGLLDEPKFDVKKPTIIFLHGFLSSAESNAANSVCQALIERGNMNVLALDSGKLLGYFYIKSTVCVQFVGRALGRVFEKLVKGGVDPKKIHTVGHSLGAHMSGFAGKTFFNNTGEKIARITGLDPAGPCFFQERPDLRLNEADADFVDVIHSDSGILGLTETLGDVDFYPNSGEAQPGCAIPPCSHSRAWALFSESISHPESFPAVPCAGWDTFVSRGCDNKDKAFMGFEVSKEQKGKYYLRTNREFPFGQGKHASEVTTKSSFLTLF